MSKTEIWSAEASHYEGMILYQDRCHEGSNRSGPPPFAANFFKGIFIQFFGIFPNLKS